MIEATPEEALEIKRQNKFGLQVIAGALLFTSLILFVLSTFTTSGAGITATIAGVVLLATWIPYSASRKINLHSLSA